MATSKQKRIAFNPPIIPPEVAYHGKRPNYPGYQKPKKLKSAKDLFVEQRENAINEWREERN